MIGKIIGMIIGLNISSGFLGLILGLYLGHQFDLSRRAPWTRSQRSSTNKIFIKTLFTLLGKISKADGRVSEDEVQQTETLISRMKMSTDGRKEAIRFFKNGANSNQSVEQIMNDFVRTCGRYNNLKVQLLQCLLILALADNDLHAKEREILNSVAGYLRISSFDLERLIQMMSAQTRFNYNNNFNRDSSSASESQLKDAYEILGASESDNNKKIKQIYRKLISENHPDKLIGQGMPENLIAMATERTQKIQSAYDLIKKHRDF